MGTSTGLRPRTRRYRQRTLTVVVHDDLFEGNAVRPGEAITLVCGHLALQYVPQSVAEREGIEADEWICPQPPRVTGRRPLFETVIGETFEQDPDGTLVYNGSRHRSGIVLSYGDPDSGGERILRAGHRAAILLDQQDRDGVWRARSGITCAVLWIYAPPAVRFRREAGTAWLSGAAKWEKARRGQDRRCSLS